MWLLLAAISVFGWVVCCFADGCVGVAGFGLVLLVCLAVLLVNVLCCWFGGWCEFGLCVGGFEFGLGFWVVLGLIYLLSVWFVSCVFLCLVASRVVGGLRLVVGLLGWFWLLV